jgi:hypothetical protein
MLPITSKETCPIIFKELNEDINKYIINVCSRDSEGVISVNVNIIYVCSNDCKTLISLSGVNKAAWNFLSNETFFKQFFIQNHPIFKTLGQWGLRTLRTFQPNNCWKLACVIFSKNDIALPKNFSQQKVFEQEVCPQIVKTISEEKKKEESDFLINYTGSDAKFKASCGKDPDFLINYVKENNVLNKLVMNKFTQFLHLINLNDILVDSPHRFFIFSVFYRTAFMLFNTMADEELGKLTQEGFEGCFAQFISDTHEVPNFVPHLYAFYSSNETFISSFRAFFVSCQQLAENTHAFNSDLMKKYVNLLKTELEIFRLSELDATLNASLLLLDLKEANQETLTEDSPSLKELITQLYKTLPKDCIASLRSKAPENLTSTDLTALGEQFYLYTVMFGSQLEKLKPNWMKRLNEFLQ